jgi:hypothetical protein
MPKVSEQTTPKKEDVTMSKVATPTTPKKRTKQVKKEVKPLELGRNGVLQVSPLQVATALAGLRAEINGMKIHSRVDSLKSAKYILGIPMETRITRRKLLPILEDVERRMNLVISTLGPIDTLDSLYNKTL